MDATACGVSPIDAATAALEGGQRVVRADHSMLNGFPASQQTQRLLQQVANALVESVDSFIFCV
eukprot:m.32682 g.32682  ORF g.32682 m.32682 type:complete len:64 (-) comp9544_c0_seq2:609-800(-)